MPDITLPMSQDKYEAAGSKFVVLPLGKKEAYYDIECDGIDWKQAGISLQLPVTITDTEAGVNAGKTDALYMGVKEDAIFKLKDVLTTLGIPVRFVKGKPVFDSSLSGGKKAVGHWVTDIVESRKEGHEGEKVTLVKIDGIFPAGYKPTVEEVM